jgi:hypothetical protein
LLFTTTAAIDVFRDFFATHCETFRDAPAEIAGEQNLEYYALFQQYLRLYEATLSDYISSLNVSVEEFYGELLAVKDDKTIKNKKLLHFVNYLIACTDYPSFYKVMTRAAKKLDKELLDDEPDAKSDAKADSRSSGSKADSGSKAESKYSAADSKSDTK